MRIYLNFIKKNQCVIPASEPSASNNAETYIEIFYVACRHKQTPVVIVLKKVYLYIVLKQTLAYMSDYIGLAYLTRTIDKQYLIAPFFKVLFYSIPYLSI